MDVGLVEAIRVGRAEIKNMQVSIHDRIMELGYEGLLGFDFLGRFQMSVGFGQTGAGVNTAKVNLTAVPRQSAGKRNNCPTPSRPPWSSGVRSYFPQSAHPSALGKFSASISNFFSSGMTCSVKSRSELSACF